MADPIVTPEFTVFTNEDTLLTGIDVLTLAADPDSNPTPIVVTGANAVNGTVVVEADGTLTYTPDADFNGQDTITYTIMDGDSETAVSTVLVDVAPVNDLPTVTTPDFTVLRQVDSSLNDIDVIGLSGASDIEGGLTLSSATAASGQVILNADNTITFIPEPGNNEGEVISYELQDSDGATISGEIIVNVDITPDANTVVAADDQATVQADFNGVLKAANALSNDTGYSLLGQEIDPTGAVVSNYNAEIALVNGEEVKEVYAISEFGDISLVAEITVQGDNGGSFTISKNGQVSFDAAGDFDTLAAGTSGVTGFEYTVKDDNGQLSTAYFEVTVNSSQGPFQANDDSASMIENAGLDYYSHGYDHDSITLDLLGNDNTSASTTTITDVLGATQSTTTDGLTRFTVDGSAGGLFYIYSDGTAEFDQQEEFAYLGQNESVITSATYTIEGLNGDISTATVNITIDGKEDIAETYSESVNVAAGFQGYSAIDLSDATWSTSLLENDSFRGANPYVDPDGDSIEISSVNGQSLVAGQVTVTGSNGGQFTVFSDGSVMLDASQGFESLATGSFTSTSISYVVADSNGNESASVSYSVDVIGQGGSADVVTNQDNSVLFSVPQLANLTGTYDIVALDGNGDPLPLNSFVAGDNGGSFQVYGDGNVLFNPGSVFEYLDVGESQISSFSYNATDQNGDVTTGTISVEVFGLNDGPTEFSNSYAINQGDLAVVGDVIPNDSDPEGHDFNVTSLYSYDSPLSGDFVSFGNKTTQQAFGDQGGKFIVHMDGSVTFDARHDFDHLVLGESVTTSIYYQTHDEFGASGGSFLPSINVTVHGVNSRPIGNDDSYTVTAGSNDILGQKVYSGWFVFDLRLLGNDTDVDSDALSILTVSNGNELAHIEGAQSVDVAGSEGGVFTVSADGTMSFDASGFEALGVGESITTTIEYVLTDGKVKAKAEVSVVVEGANDAVTAQDDFSVGSENNPVSGTINVLDNDETLNSNLSVVSVDGAVGNVASAVQGSNGGLFTINSDGTADFDPNNDFGSLAEGETLITSIVYEVADETGDFATATLSVEVAGSNNAVDARDDAYFIGAGSVSELAGEVYITFFGSSFLYDNRLFRNDLDVDGDELTITQVNGQSLTSNDISIGGSNGGTFTISQDGYMTFDATVGFDDVQVGSTRETTVQYTVSDGLTQDTAIITVDVYGVDDPVV